jgi:hypothetical protein
LKKNKRLIFLEGFESVTKKIEAENWWLTESNVWLGGSKRSLIDCLQ